MFNQEQFLLHHLGMINTYETFRQDWDFHCRRRTVIMIQPEDNILQGTSDLPLELCLLSTLPLTRTRVIKTPFSCEQAPHHYYVLNTKWLVLATSEQLQHVCCKHNE